MKFLFLHTELANYFLVCVRALVQHGGVVHIVRLKVNRDAKFDFEFGDGIHVYQRDEYDLSQLTSLAKRIRPDTIVCAGWTDIDYLSVCHAMRKHATTILAFDTEWKGTWKQHLARLASRMTICRIFRHVWVAGDKQAVYAQKLGFSPKRVWKGVYSADTEMFSSTYETFKEAKSNSMPHRFLFVGRYVESKGIRELWDAFIELKSEFISDWELWCLGTGDYPPMQHPSIKHFGFIQPQHLAKYTKDTSVFVMPSRSEPWGVVLHEFAVSGFPIVCSNAVGAAAKFVRPGENGFVFQAGVKNELKECLYKVITMNDNELLHMSQISHELGTSWSPKDWAKQLLEMANPGKFAK